MDMHVPLSLGPSSILQDFTDDCRLPEASKLDPVTG